MTLATALPPTSGSATDRASGPARAAAWLRARAGTTPGLLRILSVALGVSIALLWAAALAAVLVRDDAVHAVSADAAPAFAAAQRLHADLSEADATIVSAFLAGPVEPPEQRKAYDDSIAAAEGELRTLARAGDGSPAARGALDTLHQKIPAYTELVGQARANNRQEYVVGGAYLRQASLLMQGTILPAADSLAVSSAEQVDDGYRRATSSVHVALVSAAGVISLVALAGVQLWLFRRTHRLLNVPLLVATGLVMVVFAVTLSAFSAERARLLDGRDDGFVPMSEIAQARVLGLRAWGDEGLSLIARGDGAALDADADAAIARLGYTPDGRPTGSGILPTITAYLHGEGFREGDLDALWRDYQSTSIEVRRQVTSAGGFDKALELAQGDGAEAFGRFDQAADQALTASQQRFGERLSAAGDRLGGLAAVVIVLSALAIALALAGIQARINEYR
ncbi:MULTISPECIES: hypothetical protein [Pseudofrankia]|uniref:hypothetical protein n=1 Tax=Pseudofrankia TaxID=2994363 RepID=UPI0003072813|nr:MULTISPECIES: hypothetical protein [Pseudofrankia]